MPGMSPAAGVPIIHGNETGLEAGADGTGKLGKLGKVGNVILGNVMGAKVGGVMGAIGVTGTCNG